jgi:YcxB-like protein
MESFLREFHELTRIFNREICQIREIFAEGNEGRRRGRMGPIGRICAEKFGMTACRFGIDDGISVGSVRGITLKTEYICTEAELKEAKTLNLQRQFGGGPKWRSTLFYLLFVGLLVVFLAGDVLLRVKMEILPKDRFWFIGLFITLFVVVFTTMMYFKRKTRRKQDQPVRLQISEQELSFNGGNGQLTMPWSAFGQCLESESLFVLLDKPKRLLFAVPKRAFPDEKSREWFRTLTQQLEKAAKVPAVEAASPGKFAKGVSLTVQLKFRDYLVRTLTSWRFRGPALAIFILFTGIGLFTPAPPHAVNSRGKTMLIGFGVLIPMFTVLFFVVSFFAWRLEKKYLAPKQLALSEEGIHFAETEGSGLLAWPAYKYYLENRWAFFIWNPQGALWMMFPKRAFASPMEIEQTRDLLQKNLKLSAWFIF